jgi:hypothetical protein
MQNFIDDPITPCHFSCIGKSRFSTIPDGQDVDVVGIFTILNRPFRQSDLTTLAAMARKKLFLMTFDNRTSWNIVNNIIAPVNIYDYFISQQKE